MLFYTVFSCFLDTGWGRKMRRTYKKFKYLRSLLSSVIIRGPKIFQLSGTFFGKTEKRKKFLKFLFFQLKKIFLFSDEQK
jgi:hypothetical protein